MTIKTLPLTFSARFAARTLSAALGDTEMTWMMRLANWRKPERTSPIPWQSSEAGHPVYDADDLNAFIAARQIERGSVAPDQNQKAKVGALHDAEDGQGFVRLMWNSRNAQGTVSLSVASAEDLIRQLQRSVTRARALTESRQANGEPGGTAS